MPESLMQFWGRREKMPLGCICGRKVVLSQLGVPLCSKNDGGCGKPLNLCSCKTRV